MAVWLMAVWLGCGGYNPPSPEPLSATTCTMCERPVPAAKDGPPVLRIVDGGVRSEIRGPVDASQSHDAGAGSDAGGGTGRTPDGGFDPAWVSCPGLEPEVRIVDLHKPGCPALPSSVATSSGTAVTWAGPESSPTFLRDSDLAGNVFVETFNRDYFSTGNTGIIVAPDGSRGLGGGGGNAVPRAVGFFSIHGIGRDDLGRILREVRIDAPTATGWSSTLVTRGEAVGGPPEGPFAVASAVDLADGGTRIEGRTYSAHGALLFGPFDVAEEPRAYPRATGVNDNGDVLVLWQPDTVNVGEGRWFHADGTPYGAAFTTGAMYDVKVERLPGGRLLAGGTVFAPAQGVASSAGWVSSYGGRAQRLRSGALYAASSQFWVCGTRSITLVRPDGEECGTVSIIGPESPCARPAFVGPDGTVMEYAGAECGRTAEDSAGDRQLARRWWSGLLK